MAVDHCILLPQPLPHLPPPVLHLDNLTYLHTVDALSKTGPMLRVGRGVGERRGQGGSV